MNIIHGGVIFQKSTPPTQSIGVCRSHKVVAVGFNTLCYDAKHRGIKPSARIKIIEPHHKFIEVSKNGTQIVFTITAIKPYSLYEFDMENKYFSGHWIGRFYELSEKETKIVFTEILNIKNPIMEILSYICMNLKRMQKKYISDLIKELEKQKVSSS